MIIQVVEIFWALVEILQYVHGLIDRSCNNFSNSDRGTGHHNDIQDLVKSAKSWQWTVYTGNTEDNLLVPVGLKYLMISEEVQKKRNQGEGGKLFWAVPSEIKRFALVDFCNQ